MSTTKSEEDTTGSTPRTPGRTPSQANAFAVLMESKGCSSKRKSPVDRRRLSLKKRKIGSTSKDGEVNSQQKHQSHNHDSPPASASAGPDRVRKRLYSQTSGSSEEDENRNLKILRDNSRDLDRDFESLPNANDGYLQEFTKEDIEKLMKEYVRFGRAPGRVQKIAKAADLEDRSLQSLEQLVQEIDTRCRRILAENDPDGEKKGNHKDLKFRMKNVLINAKTTDKEIAALVPLVSALPTDTEERKKYKLDIDVQPAKFDCPWEKEDDTDLLKGIYEHGFENWEAIKQDQDLSLKNKILPAGTAKPQASDLKKRAKYLFRQLEKEEGRRRRSTDVESSLRSPRTKQLLLSNIISNQHEN